MWVAFTFTILSFTSSDVDAPHKKYILINVNLMTECKFNSIDITRLGDFLKLGSSPGCKKNLSWASLHVSPAECNRKCNLMDDI